MKNRKYQVAIDGYCIRTNADFLRVDMSKSQRNKYNRSLKLGKRNWYKELFEVTLEIIEDMRR